MDDTIARLWAYIEILEMKFATIDDRVAVLEEITADHEGRLEDIEEGAEEDSYLKGD